MKIDGSDLEKKKILKMVELCFSSKLNWWSCIVSIGKTSSNIIAALIHSMYEGTF